MLGILLLLPWLLAPFWGFFLLVWGADERTAEFLLAAPVSLVQATRAAEAAMNDRVIRAYVGTRRRPPRYVLIMAGQSGPRRLWVDIETGTITNSGYGQTKDGLVSGALPLADLLEAAEQQAGGRAISAEGGKLAGQAAIEIHVLTQERLVEVYLDPYTAQVLVTVDRKAYVR